VLPPVLPGMMLLSGKGKKKEDKYESTFERF
jgi:hypothetical protein